FTPLLISKAPTDEVHLPIIKLAQNKEINGAILSVGICKSCFKKAGRLDAVDTSTPTYTKIPIIPITSCGYFKTLALCNTFSELPASSTAIFSRSILFGTEENLKAIAANKKTAPKIRYGIFT